jgi:hypothetical protein
LISFVLPYSAAARPSRKFLEASDTSCFPPPV